MPNDDENCPVSGQPCGHILEGHCDEHLLAMERRAMDRRAIDGLTDKTSELEKKCNELCKQTLLINKDLGYIKKPLSVIAGAIILYILGAMLKVIPYLASITEGK